MKKLIVPLIISLYILMNPGIVDAERLNYEIRIAAFGRPFLKFANAYYENHDTDSLEKTITAEIDFITSKFERHTAKISEDGSIEYVVEKNKSRTTYNIDYRNKTIKEKDGEEFRFVEEKMYVLPVLMYEIINQNHFNDAQEFDFFLNKKFGKVWVRVKEKMKIENITN